MKIQLVDDEPFLLKAMQRELRRYGDWETHSFTSAEDALEGLERHEYDIIISDYSMPKSSGVDYLQQVRQKQPNAKRVLLTAWADQQVLADAINRAQVHCYWPKPWQVSQLLELMKSHEQAVQP